MSIKKVSRLLFSVWLMHLLFALADEEDIQVTLLSDGLLGCPRSVLTGYVHLHTGYMAEIKTLVDQ